MGGATTNVNGLSVVHKGSSGTAASAPPDVCLTPAPAGPPMPMPYPNTAMSSDLEGGTTTVKVDNKPAAIQGSTFAKSTGDEPGTGGGLMSGTCMMEAEFITYSPTVCADGAPMSRLSDMMTMNHKNTLTPGEMQAPLPPVVPALLVLPPPDKPRVCKFDNLKVACGHSARTYTLDAEKNLFGTLQVITSTKSEKLDFDYDASCSVPGHDVMETADGVSPGCAKIHVIGADGVQLKVGVDHSVELPLSRSVRHVGGLDWLDLLFQMSRFQPDTYYVYATTCEGQPDEEMPTGDMVVVDVFPNASWDGELTFSYSHEKRTPDNKKDKKALSQPTHDSYFQLVHEFEQEGIFEFGGKLKAALGATDLSFELAVTSPGADRAKNRLTRGMFGMATSILNKMVFMLKWIEDFYSTKLDVKWPSIKVGGKLELVEVPDSGKVVTEGSWFVGLDPLIGASFTIDILDWLIRAAGAFSGGFIGPAGAVFAEYLIKIKQKAAKGNRYAMVDIGIRLTVGGDVGGSLGYKVSQGKWETDGAKAKAEAGVEFKLEGVAKGESRICIIQSACFKAATGASVAMQSADGKSPSRISGTIKPIVRANREQFYSVDGSFVFNGLAVYYSLYAEMGVDGEEASWAEKADDRVKGKKTTAKPKGGAHQQLLGKKDEKLCAILEPWEWPMQGLGNAASQALIRM